MSPMIGITSFISWLISIYMFICLIRIITTWFPTLQNTKFVYYLKKICDPYLNLFRQIPFLHIGNLDFTPVLAIGILVIASNILSSIVSTGALRFGALLGSLLQLLWSIASSVITFFNIIITLRLIVNLLHKDYSSGIWSQLDRIIYPVQKFVTSLIKGKTFSYKAQLGITLIACILVQILGSLLIGFIVTLLTKLPF